MRLGVKVCGWSSGVVDWVEGVLLGSSEASWRREAAVGDEVEFFMCTRMMYASYSREARRRASREMTSSKTPMQDPANMPLLRMCQLLERKPE